jgi:hypothetical protein
MLTNDRQYVTSSLQTVRSDTLYRGVIGVLALIGVLEDAKEHICNVDEDVCSQHT